MPGYIEYEFVFSTNATKAKQLTRDFEKCLKENSIRYIRAFISSYNMVLFEVADQATMLRLLNAMLPYRTVRITCTEKSYTLSTVETGAKSFKIRL